MARKQNAKVAHNKILSALYTIAQDKSVPPFYRLHALDRLATMGGVYKVEVGSMERPQQVTRVPRAIEPPTESAPAPAATESEGEPFLTEGQRLLDEFNQKIIGGLSGNKPGSTSQSGTTQNSGT